MAEIFWKRHIYLWSETLPSLTCSRVCWSLLSSSCKEKEKKNHYFSGKPLEISSQPQDRPSQPQNKTIPEWHLWDFKLRNNNGNNNNDKETNILLVIQHKFNRKYQSYKNNTQSKRGKFSFSSWVSLIPEMLLGIFVLQSKPIQALNEEISSLHQFLFQQFSVADVELGIPTSMVIPRRNPSLAFST